MLLQALQGSGNLATSGILLGILGVSLALRLRPILVEATLNIVTQVLSPDGSQGLETTGSGNVTNDTDNDHGGSLDDGDGLNNLLLVHLASRAIQITDDMGHAGLVAHEGGEVDGLTGIILGEGLDMGTHHARTLAGKESEGTVTGSFKLAVRLYRERKENGWMDERGRGG